MHISEPGYGFDSTLLTKYNPMSFGGPPVTVETVEEAEDLMRVDDKESAIGKLSPQLLNISSNLLFVLRLLFILLVIYVQETSLRILTRTITICINYLLEAMISIPYRNPWDELV